MSENSKIGPSFFYMNCRKEKYCQKLHIIFGHKMRTNRGIYVQKIKVKKILSNKLHSIIEKKETFLHVKNVLT